MFRSNAMVGVICAAMLLIGANRTHAETFSADATGSVISFDLGSLSSFSFFSGGIPSISTTSISGSASLTVNGGSVTAPPFQLTGDGTVVVVALSPGQVFLGRVFLMEGTALLNGTPLDAYCFAILQTSDRTNTTSLFGSVVGFSISPFKMVVVTLRG